MQFEARTLNTMRQFGLSDRRAHAILISTVEPAIKYAEKLDWIAGDYACNSWAEGIEIPDATPDELEEICAVCLMGAVQLAAYKDNPAFGTDYDRDTAIALTSSYLEDRISYEPEAVSPLYEGMTTIRPTHWNDGLPNSDTENDPKDRVVAFLKKALNDLQGAEQ